MADKPNGLFQAAKVATIVGVMITLMAIVFYAGGQANTVKTNTRDIRFAEEANAATVELVGELAGVDGKNTADAVDARTELWTNIMDIREEVAAIKAIQTERNKP